eukprot:2972117-Pyramimonas_sp.AAC.1
MYWYERGKSVQIRTAGIAFASPELATCVRGLALGEMSSRRACATISPGSNVTIAVAYSRKSVFGTNTPWPCPFARRYPARVSRSETSVAMSPGLRFFPRTDHGIPASATWGPAMGTLWTVFVAALDWPVICACSGMFPIATSTAGKPSPTLCPVNSGMFGPAPGATARAVSSMSNSGLTFAMSVSKSSGTPNKVRLYLAGTPSMVTPSG